MSVEFYSLTAEFYSINREDNRKVTVFKDHDAEQASRVMAALITGEWNLSTVTIETHSDNGVDYDIPAATLITVVDALISDPDNAGAIIGYGETFGWDQESAFEAGRWGQRNYEDGFYSYTDNVEEWAEEHVKECYYETFSNMPDFIADAIDWEKLSDAIREDYEEFEIGGYIYLFHKSW